MPCYRLILFDILNDKFNWKIYRTQKLEFCWWIFETSVAGPKCFRSGSGSGNLHLKKSVLNPSFVHVTFKVLIFENFAKFGRVVENWCSWINALEANSEKLISLAPKGHFRALNLYDWILCFRILQSQEISEKIL